MATKGNLSPNIPNVPAGLDKSTRDFLSAVKESLETMQGKRRGPKSETVVTFADLEGMGLRIAQKAVGTDAEYDFSRLIRNSTPPNPPRDLVVDQQIFANKLTWMNPSDEYLSHIEVWSSVGSSSLSDALRLGIVTKPVTEFIHAGLNTRTAHYYWIRSVDWSGNYSTWEPKQGGFVVPASLGKALEETLHVLQNSITESQLYGDLNSRLDNIEANKAQIEISKTDIAGVLAQYFIKTDVDGHIAGFGLANDGATSEAIFLVDKFAVVTPGSIPKIPFVIGTVDGNSTIGIDGDMIVDGAIATRTLDAEIITGAFLSASAQIQLGTGGLLRMGEGAKLFAGDGNFLLNTEGDKTSLMIGKDGALDVNGNVAAGSDYMLLADGDIEFYRWLANGHRMYKALKRWETGFAENGTWVNLPGYWVAPPQIQLSPRNLTCYKNSSPADQALNMEVTSIEEYATNQFRFMANARLIIAAGAQDYPIGFAASGVNSAGPTFSYSTPANCTKINATFKIASVAPATVSATYYYRSVVISMFLNGVLKASTTVSIGATLGYVTGVLTSGVITAGAYGVTLSAAATTSASTFQSGTVAWEYTSSVANLSFSNNAHCASYADQYDTYDTDSDSSSFSMSPPSPGAGWEFVSATYSVTYAKSSTVSGGGSVNHWVEIGGQKVSGSSSTVTGTLSLTSMPTTGKIVAVTYASCPYSWSDNASAYVNVTLGSIVITTNWKRQEGNAGATSTNLTFESATMDTGAVNELAAGTVNYIAIGE
ncbi:hypothetical protein [Maridesulfovibrio ferrireducens]|uniref:phage tail tip fiber protein n=1 Tax=Maridesulfovibrio ferrireducens TaxID=246191 RepID=UPI001A1DB847|nr:hypothetical protein [Maridesulfovibrio ferrireducens]MBI9113169.1 hypothetical protein [Maridesulfovibrio ferrireducens]